jgi:hypothetical protein
MPVKFRSSQEVLRTLKSVTSGDFVSHESSVTAAPRTRSITSVGKPAKIDVCLGGEAGQCILLCWSQCLKRLRIKYEGGLVPGAESRLFFTVSGWAGLHQVQSSLVRLYYWGVLNSELRMKKYKQPEWGCWIRRTLADIQVWFVVPGFPWHSV